MCAIDYWIKDEKPKSFDNTDSLLREIIMKSWTMNRNFCAYKMKFSSPLALPMCVFISFLCLLLCLSLFISFYPPALTLLSRVFFLSSSFSISLSFIQSLIFCQEYKVVWLVCDERSTGLIFTSNTCLGLKTTTKNRNMWSRKCFPLA